MANPLHILCFCSNTVECYPEVGGWTVCGCGRIYNRNGKEVLQCPPNQTISGTDTDEITISTLYRVRQDRFAVFVDELRPTIFHGDGDREHAPPQGATPDAKPYTHGEHRGHMVEQRSRAKHGNVLLYCVYCRKQFSGAEKHILKEPSRDPNSYIR